jgi:tetratricopeptide (TPR) repeat protein
MIRGPLVAFLVWAAIWPWPVLAANVAPAAEDVRIRGGVHPSFLRVVFDWRAPVDFNARIEGRNLIVDFGRSGNYDPAPLLRVLSPYLGRPEVSREGRRVVLPLKKDFSLSSFDLTERVVLDLGAPGAGDESTARASDVARPPYRGTSWPRESAPKALPEMAVSPPRTSEVLGALRPERAEKARSGRKWRSGAEAPMSLTTTGKDGDLPKRKGRTATGDNTPGRASRAPGQLEVGIGEREVATNAVPLGYVPEPDPPIHLRFTWQEPPAVAAFRYGEEIWLVFDAPVAADAAARIEEADVGLEDVRRLDSDHGSTVILKAASPLVARLQREEKGWLVDLRTRAPLPDREMDHEVVDAGLNTVLRFMSEDAGEIHWLVDPASGERLVVIPAKEPGHGTPMTRIYPQLQVLHSQQGLVLRPLGEGLEVAVTQNGVLVRHKDGLLLSSEKTRELAPFDRAARNVSHRLFRLSRWRRGDSESFVENKQKLMAAAVAATGDDLVKAHLNLARFYFAWGLAVEALGLLNVIESEAPRFADDPEIKLMRAVSALLIKNYDMAGRLLSDPALAEEQEAILWQAAYAAIVQDWDVAVSGFDLAQPLIFSYPAHVRSNLLLSGAEARLCVGDTGGASEYLIALSRQELSLTEEARAKYLTGRRFYLDGNRELAVKVWRELKEDSHQASRARARLGLLDLAVEEGRKSTEDAISELERLRFAWRGDDFELALLLHLSELYESAGRPRDALRTLQQLATRFPNRERAGHVAARMRSVFSRTLTDASGEALAPLEALAIYREFKELTPSGDEGDRIVVRLADRLVEIDLLDKAARILEDQVLYRRQGQARAKLGARLAVVRLLNRQFEEALVALEISEQPNLPSDLQEQRLLLRARALTKLGRHPDALEELGDNESGEGMLLRAEILWRLEDWKRAAAAFDRVVPEKPPQAPLSDAEAQRVMNLAIALTMAEGRVKLAGLYKRYADSMAETEHGAAFRLLGDDITSPNYSSIEQGLDQVEKAQEFYDKYRDSL